MRKRATSLPLIQPHSESFQNYMDLFAFIHHADPTKVRIGERQIEEGQVPLLDSTVGYVIPFAGENDQARKISKRKKRRAAGGASGSNHPLKKLREDHGTFGNVTASTGGKSLAVIQNLFERSTLNVDVGVAAVKTVPFVTSFMTTTLEREGGGNTDFVSGPNLHTQHPSERFIISSDSSHHSSINAADAEVASLARSSISPPPVMTATVTTTVIAGVSSAPVLGADAKPVTQVYQSVFMDSAFIGAAGPDIAGPSNLAGIKLPQILFMFLRKWTPRLSVRYMFLNETWLMSPFLMILMCAVVWLISLPLLDSFPSFAVWIMISYLPNLMLEQHIKHVLVLREAEAAEAIRLRSQVSVVETSEAARVSELNSLKEQNIVLKKEKNALEGQVVTLESVAAAKDTELMSLNAQTAKLTQDLSSLQLSCDELSIKADSLESQRNGIIDQVKDLSNRVTGLDSELMALALHLDEESYPRILTTIAGRRWIIGHGFRLAIMKCRQSPEYAAAFGAVIGLAIDKGIQAGLVAGIDHGKSGRSLANIASYDPSVEARYVSPVLAFRDLDFNLLHKLESRKDASIADIMNSLCLEGPSVETLKFSR
ncbi:hypothetical protein Tco_1260958 [Tanacetum coccineum]